MCNVMKMGLLKVLNLEASRVQQSVPACNAMFRCSALQIWSRPPVAEHAGPHKLVPSDMRVCHRRPTSHLLWISEPPQKWNLSVRRLTMYGYLWQIAGGGTLSGHTADGNEDSSAQQGVLQVLQSASPAVLQSSMQHDSHLPIWAAAPPTILGSRCGNPASSLQAWAANSCEVFAHDLLIKHKHSLRC